RLLEGIFTDERRAPRERLRVAMRAFFRTEHDEAPLRRALGAAAPLYHDKSIADAHRKRGMPLLRRLVAAAAPRATPRRHRLAAELYIALLSSMGEHVSETARSRRDVDRWAATTADMFLAWLGAQ